MAVVLGLNDVSDATGWTSITPAGTPQNGYNGSAPASGNSMLIYVSSSTGKDSGDVGFVAGTAGSLSTPFRTIAQAASHLRTGQPDWLLLLKGDTWTNDGLGTIAFSGQDQNNPIVITSYTVAGATTSVPRGTGTGSRPLIKMSPGHTFFYSTTAGTGDYIAIIGLELLAYTCVPGGSFVLADTQNNTFFAIAFNAVWNWICVEDCKVTYFYENFSFNTSGVGASATLIFRRNIIANAYSLGMILAGATSPTISENIYYQNGWNSAMGSAASVTVAAGSPGTVTWTGHNLSNGMKIYFHPGGNGLTQDTDYTVTGLSGNSFTLLDSGSNPVAISGSGTMTAYNTYFSETVFKHGLYSQENSFAAQYSTIYGNLWIGDCSNDFSREPATVKQNLFFDSPIAFTQGRDTAGTFIHFSNVLYNVFLHGKQNTPRYNGGFGMEFSVCQAANYGDIVYDHNITAHISTTYAGSGIDIDASSNKLVVSNNIVWDWNTIPYNDRSNNDNTGASADTHGSANYTNYNNLLTDHPNYTWWTVGTPPGAADTARTILSYTLTIPGGGSATDNSTFISLVLGQSKDNWRSDLMAQSVNSYIRAGFGMADPSTRHGGKELGKF